MKKAGYESSESTQSAVRQGEVLPPEERQLRQWEDAFEVEFDDGLSFLEPHGAIRKANKISAKAAVESVELEEELRHGFFVHYDNGQTAEVSWSFIRELPPKKQG